MPSTTIHPVEVSTSHRTLFAFCLLCYLFGGMVSTLMSVYLPLVVRELVGNVSEAQLGQVGAYIGSTFLYGWMLGGIAFGVAGDHLGRVRTFVAAVALYATFTLLTAWASHWILVVVYRFLSGMGVGGVLVLATVLVSEAWPAKSRNVALGILAVSFPVGIIAAGAINNLLPEWRTAFQVGWIPLGLALLALLTLKESARWQKERQSNQSTQRNPAALLTHTTYARSLWMGSLIFGSVLVGLWAIFSWLPTWVQSLFDNPAMGQQERGLTMMLLGSGGILGGGLSGWLVNRLGYRKTLLITFGGSFATCWLLFTTNAVFSPMIYLETGLLALFFGISQGALSAFIPALFPASIRSTATGFCFNIGRLLTATAVFFVGTLVAVMGGYGPAVLVFSTTFLIGFGVLFLSPAPTIAQE